MHLILITNYDIILERDGWFDHTKDVHRYVYIIQLGRDLEEFVMYWNTHHT